MDVPATFLSTLDKVREEVRNFLAHGMLLTVVGALDLIDLIGDPIAVLKELATPAP